MSPWPRPRTECATAMASSSFHSVHYPSSSGGSSTHSEDPGDLHDHLPEEEEEVGPHDPPEVVVGSHERNQAAFHAWRALDLMFPREDSDDGSDVEDSDWSDWSARDEDDDRVDHGQQAVHYDANAFNGDVTDEEDKETATTICPAGKEYPKSEAEEIEHRWLVRYSKQTGHSADLRNQIMARALAWEEGEEVEDDGDTPFTPYPLYVFPHATASCILGNSPCYHSLYKTHDTSTSPSSLGYRTPEEMLQFFSIRLIGSQLPSGPVDLYGIFAVRDELDQRRNYVFNRMREDAVTIEKQDSFSLPLCSPCRGMYVRERALLEVDLWVKNKGDQSDDKQLLSAYAEMEIRTNFDDMLYGRIIGDVCNLDMEYMVLTQSVETVIQVYAKVDHPRRVRFTASSTSYGGDIVMFDDKLFDDKKLFQHIVPVKENETLDVILKVEQLLFRWTFQDEHVGAVSSPDDSIFEYGQFFVRIFFAPKDCQ